MYTIENQTGYFDYNASAPMRTSVKEAMMNAMELIGNPSSVHVHGREAQDCLEEARQCIASTIGAESNQLIFTSGGTEANNLAFRTARNLNYLVSAIEHDSVLASVPRAVRIPVKRDGVINIETLQDLLSRQTNQTLVSVMLANNETGVIQPLDKIVTIARTYNAIVHCDAVQALGKLPIDMNSLGVDLMTLSAHKIGGPKGIGILALGPNAQLKAGLVGGGQERRRRAGTENIIGAIGFAEACRIVNKNTDETDRVLNLRDYFEKYLRTEVPNIEIFGSNTPRLVNTTCVRLAGKTSEIQVIALDLAGISVSAGAACSSGKVTGSHVLMAMGINPIAANESIRFSIGWNTTKTDVLQAAKAWLTLYDQTKNQSRKTAA